ncbi:hypothetical protein L1887_40516 [Cichorium endivia]|nr:hypothetical protein L1887_40516 [Cichorium endivia]
MSVRRCRVPWLVTFKVGAQLSALFGAVWRWADAQAPKESFNVTPSRERKECHECMQLETTEMRTSASGISQLDALHKAFAEPFDLGHDGGAVELDLCLAVRRGRLRRKAKAHLEVPLALERRVKETADQAATVAVVVEAERVAVQAAQQRQERLGRIKARLGRRAQHALHGRQAGAGIVDVRRGANQLDQLLGHRGRRQHLARKPSLGQPHGGAERGEAMAHRRNVRVVQRKRLEAALPLEHDLARAPLGRRRLEPVGEDALEQHLFAAVHHARPKRKSTRQHELQAALVLHLGRGVGVEHDARRGTGHLVADLGAHALEERRLHRLDRRELVGPLARALKRDHNVVHRQIRRCVRDALAQQLEIERRGHKRACATQTGRGGRHGDDRQWQRFERPQILGELVKGRLDGREALLLCADHVRRSRQRAVHLEERVKVRRDKVDLRLVDGVMAVEHVREDAARDGPARRLRGDGPHDTLEHAPVLEPTQLRHLAPEGTEALGLFGLLARRTVLHHPPCLLAVENHADLGIAQRSRAAAIQPPRARQSAGGRMHESNELGTPLERARGGGADLDHGRLERVAKVGTLDGRRRRDANAVALARLCRQWQVDARHLVKGEGRGRSILQEERIKVVRARVVEHVERPAGLVLEQVDGTGRHECEQVEHAARVDEDAVKDLAEFGTGHLVGPGRQACLGHGLHEDRVGTEVVLGEPIHDTTEELVAGEAVGELAAACVGRVAFARTLLLALQQMRKDHGEQIAQRGRTRHEAATLLLRRSELRVESTARAKAALEGPRLEQQTRISKGGTRLCDRVEVDEVRKVQHVGENGCVVPRSSDGGCISRSGLVGCHAHVAAQRAKVDGLEGVGLDRGVDADVALEL